MLKSPHRVAFVDMPRPRKRRVAAWVIAAYVAQDLIVGIGLGVASYVYGADYAAPWLAMFGI